MRKSIAMETHGMTAQEFEEDAKKMKKSIKN
jgi:hypothetical protein